MRNASISSRQVKSPPRYPPQHPSFTPEYHKAVYYHILSYPPPITFGQFLPTVAIPRHSYCILFIVLLARKQAFSLHPINTRHTHMTLPSVFFSRYNLCQVFQSFFLQGKTRLPIKVKLYAKLKKSRNPHSQAPGKVFEISKATRIIPFTKHQAPSTEHRAPSTEHQAPSTKRHRAPSAEHQATSTKRPSTEHQAPSDTRHASAEGTQRATSVERRGAATGARAASDERQAPSDKRRATSAERHAPSDKRRATMPSGKRRAARPSGMPSGLWQATSSRATRWQGARYKGHGACNGGMVE